ncbi:MAG TPA: DUF1064 domain-containing protein [Thermomicrobiales bacterium]|jgi:hypothetical protein
MTDNTISVEEYHLLVAQEGKRRNKYGAVAVIDEVHGRFDSTGEHRRWHELLTLQGQGVITDLRRQVRFPLVVEGVEVSAYIADFCYDEAGIAVVEDWKSSGTRTALYKLKRKLMKALYDVDIKETGL